MLRHRRQFTNTDFSELKARVSLQSIVARDVKLTRAGGGLLVGRCLFHAENTPSLTVYPDQHFHCFGCGAHGDVIDWIRQRDHLTFREAIELLGGTKLGASARQAPSPAPRAELTHDQHALKIWRQASPIAGTPGEAYLRDRGIVDVDLPSSLRFHRGLYHYPTARFWPAIVAAVQEPPPGRSVVAIHRTFIDGSKTVKPRLRLGHCPGGAIRLGPATGETWLVVGEGLESVLSLMQGERLPGWVAMGAGNLPRLALPAEAIRILVGVDNDTNGIGEAKAREAARNWVAQGRRVRLLIPAARGNDFNDLLVGHRHVA